MAAGDKGHDPSGGVGRRLTVAEETPPKAWLEPIINGRDESPLEAKPILRLGCDGGWQWHHHHQHGLCWPSAHRLLISVDPKI